MHFQGGGPSKFYNCPKENKHKKIPETQSKCEKSVSHGCLAQQRFPAQTLCEGVGDASRWDAALIHKQLFRGCFLSQTTKCWCNIWLVFPPTPIPTAPPFPRCLLTFPAASHLILPGWGLFGCGKQDPQSDRGSSQAISKSINHFTPGGKMFYCN